MHYFEKIEVYNVKLAELITLIFNGFHAVIVGITSRLMKETLFSMMEIPLRDERWSKGMPLDVICYE